MQSSVSFGWELCRHQGSGTTLWQCFPHRQSLPSGARLAEGAGRCLASPADFLRQGLEVSGAVRSWHEPGEHSWLLLEKGSRNADSPEGSSLQCGTIHEKKKVSAVLCSPVGICVQEVAHLGCTNTYSVLNITINQFIMAKDSLGIKKEFCVQPWTILSQLLTVQVPRRTATF